MIFFIIKYFKLYNKITEKIVLTNMSYNKRTKKEVLDCHEVNLDPLAGKRKYNDAFDTETFDDDRYNQHIGHAFFESKTSDYVGNTEDNPK